MMLRPIQHLRARRCIETKDLIRVSVLWCSLSALWDQVWDTSVGKLGVEAVDTVLVVQTYSVEMPQDRKLGCSTSLPDCTFCPLTFGGCFSSGGSDGGSSLVSTQAKMFKVATAVAKAFGRVLSLGSI